MLEINKKEVSVYFDRAYGQFTFFYVYLSKKIGHMDKNYCERIYFDLCRASWSF
jgi:hypothetical protein